MSTSNTFYITTYLIFSILNFSLLDSSSIIVTSSRHPQMGTSAQVGREGLGGKRRGGAAAPLGAQGSGFGVF